MKMSKIIGVIFLALVGCIPNVGELGQTGSSSLLVANVATGGILDKLTVTSGSINDHINAYSVKHDEICNGVMKTNTTPAVGFSNQSVDLSFNPDCDQEIMLFIGDLNGTQVSPIHIFNRGGEALKISSSELKAHQTSSPSQPFPMSINLYFTAEAAKVGISEIAANGTQQTVIPGQDVVVPPVVVPPTVVPPVVEQQQTVSQCKVVLATGRRADGSYWCHACQEFVPSWQSIEQNFAGRAEFVEVDYDGNGAVVPSQSNYQAKAALVSGATVQRFPSMILIDSSGQKQVTSASQSSVQSFLQSCN